MRNLLWPEEVTALLGYLRRLPTIPWAEVRQGQAIYDSRCVSCHRSNGHPQACAHAARGRRGHSTTHQIFTPFIVHSPGRDVASRGRGPASP
jgi:hypothetical protein